MNKELYLETAQIVLEECSQALKAVDPEAVQRYLDAVLGAKRVFFVGVGRVLLSLEAPPA